MTNKATGWTIGGIAICMMLGLMASDVKSAHTLDDILSFGFIGSMMAHVSTVGLAFFGGKLIPTEPQDQRKNDPKPEKEDK